MFVSVAVPIPLRRLFTYQVPDSLEGEPAPGRRVKVPLGRRKVTGTIVEQVGPPDPGIKVKPIEAYLDQEPSVTPEILELTRFVSRYYLCSWGEAIEAALPAYPGRGRVRYAWRRGATTGADSLPARAVAKRRVLAALPPDRTLVPAARFKAGEKKHLLDMLRSGLVERVEVREEPAALDPSAPGPEPALTPTPEQAAVLDEILPRLGLKEWTPFLLFGATGSGKTEVYLRAAEKTLAAGRGVLYLVPEIGLTPLLMSRLKRRFGAAVTVLHSGLAKQDRYRAWRQVRNGQCRFVVGTRSAVFAPVADLGLLVVDEEHDGSYKQQESPRYNGRDLAVLRARDAGAVLILGSATPSLESFRHARSGRYRLLRLGGRVGGRAMAKVDVVDMRKEYRRDKEIRPLAVSLLKAAAGCLERKEQVLILRNRRGYSVSVFCPGCGNRIECDQCSVTMTWHRRVDRLRCHSCDRERRTPELCPHCGEDGLRFQGEGSEKIEEELRGRFPDATITRMDRDTVRRKGAHEAMLRSFDAGEIDLMVGTQMIAKGHDFPRVTLVGIVSADQSLGLPDFRAGERVFQLLTQVAGRAGRGEKPGKVILQAFDPEHPVLLEAVRQDYEAFYDREVEYRRALRYPPFTSMIQLLVVDGNPGKAAIWADLLASAIRARGKGRFIVSGPGPAPLERIRNRFRQQILVRSPGRRKLVEAVSAALEDVSGKIPSRALVVDVDPYSLL